MLRYIPLALIVFQAMGQAAPTAATGPATLRSSATLVIVPTMVRTAAGEIVYSLRATDFRLTDNGVEQKVSLEEVERQPLAVMMVMQTGGAAIRQFSNYGGLGTMLEYVLGAAPYRVGMVTFDSRPEDSWEFSPDVVRLQDGFVHPAAGDDKAAIFDAVSFGIDRLAEQPNGFRRVLVLLSQTQDSGSKATSEEVVRRLGENNVTIYSVTFSPEKTWLKDEFTKERHENAPYQFSPDQPALLHTFNLSTPLGMALRAMKTNAAAEIASLSGGETFGFGDKKELERQLGVVANHLGNRYTLSFRLSSAGAGFHALRVEVPGREGLQVSARMGYWATASSR